MPLNATDFNWSLQHIVELDDMGVLEVRYQHMAVKRLSSNLSPVVKGKVLHHGHGYKVRLGGMELDAGDSLVFAIVMVDELAGQQVNATDLRVCGSLFSTQDIEVVLKHVNQLIGLEGFFNSVGDSIDKLLNFFIYVLVL